MSKRSHKGTGFIDLTKVEFIAGDGGDGCSSFRREKFVPRGGPDGGDGGKGGDIILRVDSHLSTLIDYKYRRVVKADRGSHGQGKDKQGKSGEDVIVRVPSGTIVKDAGTGEIIADLAEIGEIVIARGGRGGRGNASFATSTNRAPRRCERGSPGGRKEVILEIKLIADIGIVGKPNAGKSTLLRQLTRARPRVAKYPFTTLTPNLGVLSLGDDTIVLADIPGLIEGAHDGKGLGHEFLRHIERTRVLLFLLDGTSPSVSEDLDALAEELRLHDEKLADKPRMAVVNKLDLLTEDEIESLRSQGYEVFISALDGVGMKDLVRSLAKLVVDEEEEVDDGGGERTSRVLLALVASWVIPARTLANLIRREGPGCVDEFGLKGLSDRYGLTADARERLTRAYEQTPETERALTDHGAAALCFGGRGYPALLAEIPVPPAVLFVRGDLEAAATNKVAIVGSRRASFSGMKLAMDLARELALSGFTVVSGLARGIDTAAHQGALGGGGKTLAVLGSGIDLIYPPENEPLAGEISLNGAVVSEHGPGVEPLPWHFPLRNRIVSGLAVGTVVVEAAPRSGALITAKCALEQNRSVFAVPGKPGDPRSSGVNKLLKDGAKLVENIDDILEELAPQLVLDLGGGRRAAAPADMGGPEGELMNLLSDVPTHVDEISGNMGIGTGDLLGLLLTMETRGLVKSLPGKFYVRV